MLSIRRYRSRRATKAAVGILAAALLCSLLLLTPTTTAVQAQTADFPWMDTSLSAEQRAALLLPEMTLEEKVELMTEIALAEEPAVGFPRLGIPAFGMRDAGAGIAPRGWSLPDSGLKATAMPSGIALGATWDPNLVPGYATVVGNEAKNTGGNLLLGPNVDLVRQPWWGRIGATTGEDPFLTAALIKPFIEAIQDNEVMAMIKHPIAYTQEVFRSNGSNAVISERALVEVYNLPLEVASEAQVASMMCSFNKVNSVYSCENREVLTDLVRGQAGFEGFVMSDFGALHSTIASIEAGADMEFGLTSFYGPVLVEAVNNGDVDIALIDQSVTRILEPMFEVGLFDTDYSPTPIDVEAGSEEARTVQNQAITLLQHDNSTLPLSPESSSPIESIAVIGADANIIASAGGATYVEATVPVSPLAGIEARAGADIAVTHTPGNDPVNAANMLERADMTAVPSSVLAPASGTGPGLTAQYFDNLTLSDDPVITRVDPQVNYDTGFLGGTGPLDVSYASQVEPTPELKPWGFNQSVRYTGTITAPMTGTYKLNLTGWGDATLKLDGQTIIDMTGVGGLRDVSSPDLELVAGEAHTLQIDYVPNHGQQLVEAGTLLLQWSTPNGALSPAIQEAAAAAEQASVAVVYVRTFGGEIRDRVSLKLPQSADQLIAAVSAANPRTVVVLASAGPVTMPWLSEVPAVLQSYFGGQEQGSTIAAALFGDINPSGHLPITYPQSDAAVPYGLQTPWASPDWDVPHTEGINIGYRGYAAENIEPLFAFGHGLSYTTFEYGELQVTPTTGEELATVQFQLTNTGDVGGAEVAQLYLGPLPTSVETPAKQLAGFEKVYLEPGESVLVMIPVPRRSLSYYDVESNEFVTPNGDTSFFIGSSADDQLLSGSVTVDEVLENDETPPEPDDPNEAERAAAAEAAAEAAAAEAAAAEQAAAEAAAAEAAAAEAAASDGSDWTLGLLIALLILLLLLALWWLFSRTRRSGPQPVEDA